MTENRDTLRACILDRLVDLEPAVSHEPVQVQILQHRANQGVAGQGSRKPPQHEAPHIHAAEWLS